MLFNIVEYAVIKTSLFMGMSNIASQTNRVIDVTGVFNYVFY